MRRKTLEKECSNGRSRRRSVGAASAQSFFSAYGFRVAETPALCLFLILRGFLGYTLVVSGRLLWFQNFNCLARLEDSEQ